MEFLVSSSLPPSFTHSLSQQLEEKNSALLEAEKKINKLERQIILTDRKLEEAQKKIKNLEDEPCTPSLPLSLPPSLANLLEGKIKDLELIIEKNKVEADIKIKDLEDGIKDLKMKAEKTTATPREQKQILGKRLFLLIKGMYPGLTAKITHMLLKKENVEILKMFADHDYLKMEVEAAANLLKQCK